LCRDIADRIKLWIGANESETEDILFPVSETARGPTREMAEIIRKNLTMARTLWIGEATIKKERKKREKSDFLRYEDSQGRFADFHSLRHMLSRASFV